ncbi:MAG TPA: hypothetical protein VFA23_11100 [Dongiaceae bacterium]|nr:hypothetical protein [Dongiaceae bacterium]
MTTTTPTTAERLDRLETEYRHLLARLEKLEKRRPSMLWEVLRQVVMVVAVVFLLHYMGFLPKMTFLPKDLERLPLRASTIDAKSGKVQKLEANELLLLDRDGTVRARLAMVAPRDKEKGKEGAPEPVLTFFDRKGLVAREVAPAEKP